MIENISLSKTIVNVTIIDGDSIPYIISYKYKDMDPSQSRNIKSLKADIDSFIKGILNETSADEYVAFIGNKTNNNNFRYKIGTIQSYKGHRKPDSNYEIWGPIIIDHLITKWQFHISHSDYEADDHIASYVNHLRNLNNVNASNIEEGKDIVQYNITCSGIDKDLLQIENTLFFNYNTKEFLKTGSLGELIKTDKKVTGHGYKWLCFLILTGDTSDNILGVKGLGETKAFGILEPCKSKTHCLLNTFREYQKWLGKNNNYAFKFFKETYKLIKLVDKASLSEGYDLIKVKN